MVIAGISTRMEFTKLVTLLTISLVLLALNQPPLPRVAARAAAFWLDPVNKFSA
ncbi:hypothetical protein D3C80_982200 [compost metagenome]